MPVHASAPLLSEQPDAAGEAAVSVSHPQLVCDTQADSAASAFIPSWTPSARRSVGVASKHRRCCRRSGCGASTVRIVILLVLLSLCAVNLAAFTSNGGPYTDGAYSRMATPTPSNASPPKPPRAAPGAWNATLSVAVTHEAPLTCLDSRQLQQRAAGGASATVMRRSQLPSWTLRVVDALCDECLDNATHAAAVARQLGASTASADGALPAATVFATPSAPLGLAGPMLFAMASVTDGVAVGAELARWSWVLRSYAVRRQFRGASPVGLRGGTSPYLVVLGIPSTDQPVRSSLRDAQRDTWLSYAEVARSGNDFRGALLPLYIFAAAEREQPHAVLDVSPLLPTVAEYEAASAVLLRPGSAAGAVRSYAERRVRLAVDVGAVGAGDALLAESPCAAIVSRPATPAAGTGADATWLSQLASALALPVRPAAVAAAEFVCGASTALWQEALAHRNMVWVDMMTDRRPSSKKKLGEGGNWGLPVEVGMTQKTVLWLEYAYHAFPDVPYIMKGDDDTYLKVPQFMSDVRYMRAGFKGKRVRSPPEVRDAVGVAETEECIYWGSWMRGRRFSILRYHEGSGYMLHRRLVQVVLEVTDRLNAEAVHLAVTPYNESEKAVYEGLLMNVEDAFVGRVLRDRRDRIREVCPFHRATYVEERKVRHYDLYSKNYSVTWASVLMHHVSPSDQYYIHYFFAHEYDVAARMKADGKVTDVDMTATAAAWAASKVLNATQGLDRTPRTIWAHPSGLPESFVSPTDNIRVYEMVYQLFKFDALDAAYVSVTPKY